MKKENLGALIDKLYSLREVRLDLQREAEELQKQETQIHEQILKTFDKTEIEGARGKVASCSINRQIVPTVEDWDSFYKYVKQNDAFDLMQKRVSPPAYRERLEAGEVVPGVVPFEQIKLSLVKARKN